MTATALAQRDFTAVIGLEVHVQLETETKIFCGCSTRGNDAEPNTRTCPVCLGLPGALPVLNKAAVEAAVKVGKALNADIAEETQFHRKIIITLIFQKISRSHNMMPQSALMDSFQSRLRMTVGRLLSDGHISKKTRGASLIKAGVLILLNIR